VLQPCSACGGRLAIRIRRYACTICGRDEPSRFLFDGKVFDAEYFRRKMAESRQRAAQRRAKHVAQVSPEASDRVVCDAIDLTAVPGLLSVINALTNHRETWPSEDTQPRFDLSAYQRHVLTHVGEEAVSMMDLPEMTTRERLDRIGMFIAVIFLAHAGRVDVWQKEKMVMVRKRETDRERQAVPVQSETADGVQGPVGRLTA